MANSTISAATFLCFFAVGSLFGQNQTTPPMELWYQQHSYLTSPQAVQQVEATISQAAAAGYTGVALWDSSLNVVNLPWWDLTYLRQVIAFAQSKGMKVMPAVFPYGYSNDILNQNPNLAEGQHVAGTRFQVNAAGNALNVVSNFPGFQNGGFESGQSAWFSYWDAGVSLDTTTAHSGSSSALISYPPMNARLYQQVNVTPWRQYHFRIWAKTQGFTNTPQVYIMDSNDWNAQRLNAPIPTAQNQDWTAYDFTLNSASSTSLSILLGEWGGASGNLWIDDILLEETGLVYVVRRGGTPLTMYDPNNPSTVYKEGSDFNPVSDPEVAPGGFGDHWHTPPTVTLPAGTSLHPGQIVAMDYYAVVPIYGSQVGMCVTDPDVLNYLQANATALSTLLPAGSPYSLGYDEMRHMNSCALCKAKNMSAGQLLAWSVQQSVGTFQNVSPSSPLYFWSDMFDPNMNAHNDYYLAEGDFTGSWLGLPSNATILNWNLGNLATSLKFFAGQTPQQTKQFRQIIAGFYDPGDNNGANAATSEIQQAMGIPGIAGMYYTTWVDNYSQLGAFAAAAKAAWPAYVASVGGNVGSVAPQTGTIAGTVTDASNHTISGAQITAAPSSGPAATAVTANDGTFQIANLAAGTWTLTVSAAGYNTATANVTVTAGGTATANASLTAVASSATFTPIRVNAGGPAYTDSLGQVWSADTGFVGGSLYSTGAAIGATNSPALYQTERYCNGCTLEYRFTVPNGTYVVNLKFAEIWATSVGQRVFNIAINGQTYEKNFDIIRQAGGPNIAVDRRYPITVTNGVIDIQMQASVNNGKVSAIEITQSNFTPIRVNAGGPQVTDPQGRVWAADNSYTGGGSYGNGNTILNTAAPQIYQTERFGTPGTVEYQFPVANGTYTVNLKFAEIWFRSRGQRVYNIVINGQQVFANFDPFAVSGGANTAIDEQYQATVANGMLDIQLTPVVSNPKVSAIEIFQ